MQNYPYMQMIGQGPYLGYPPAPKYAPQPSPPQTQSNVDWVQVAGFEAAKASAKSIWVKPRFFRIYEILSPIIKNTTK